MNFGVPNLRAVKQVEKYSTLGVITLEPTGHKKGRKFVFNKKALEMLGLSIRQFADAKLEQVEGASIAFSFDMETIMIANTTGLTNIKEVLLTKEGSITNKDYYEYIKRLLNKEESDEVELFMEETSNVFNGQKVFKLTTEISIPNDVQEEEFTTTGEQISEETTGSIDGREFMDQTEEYQNFEEESNQSESVNFFEEKSQEIISEETFPDEYYQERDLSESTF